MASQGGVLLCPAKDGCLHSVAMVEQDHALDRTRLAIHLNFVVETEFSWVKQNHGKGEYIYA